jgi:hypothetical protein
VSPVAIVKAFLLNVSFSAPRRDSTSVAAAHLHLEDDADGHKFKVAVPSEFAEELAKRLREEGWEEEPHVLLAVAPCLMERHDSAPTLEQLLAVWDATRFVEDVVNGVCPKCGYQVENGKPDPVMGTCKDGCLGRVLRAARKRGE